MPSHGRRSALFHRRLARTRRAERVAAGFFEICGNVRQVTPVGLHASAFFSRHRRELNHLILDIMKACDKSCGDALAAETDGQCNKCRMVITTLVMSKVCTPRWVWARQSSAYLERRGGGGTPKQNGGGPSFGGRAACFQHTRFSPYQDWHFFLEGQLRRATPPISFRVPPLLVRRMTWFRGICDMNGGKALPPRFKSLTLGYCFNHSLVRITRPASLKQLLLG